MGLRDPGAVIVRGTQQNVSVAYRNDSYIANDVFPIIDGLSRQSRITKHFKGPWFRDGAGIRPPGSAARKISYTVGSQNLNPVNYASATQVVDEEVQNSRVPQNLKTDPRIDALELIANALDLKRELRTAAVIKAADWSGVGAGGEDAVGGWGHATAASDTFIADCKTVRAAFHAAGGHPPNCLLLDFYAHQALQFAPALLDKINPQGFGKEDFVSNAALAHLAMVNKIIVGTAIYDTSEPIQTGLDTNFTGVDIWDSAGGAKKGLGFFYYSPPVPSKKHPSAGYQYRLRQPNGQPRFSTGWRDSPTHSDWYDTQEELDIAAVCLDQGYLFKDTALT